MTHTEDDETEHREVADPATGRVRLCADRCATCIFRPGNLMHLEPGRVKGMVEGAIAKQGHVTCHSTLAHNGKGLPGAVCRGWEQHPAAVPNSLAVQFMWATGMVTLVDTETGELTDGDRSSLTRPTG